MNPVYMAEQTGKLSQKTNNQPAHTGFSQTLKLEKAGSLLRPTAQYEKWIKLCQKDNETAVKIADIIIERHELLTKLKTGQKINHIKFDNLTEALKKHEIVFPTQDSTPKSNTIELDVKKNKITTSPLNENIDTLPITSSEISSIISPIISDDNMLILPVKCDKYLLNNSIIGYGTTKNLLLPVGDMGRTLDFNIDVDSKLGTAKGWFISEDRNFSIDMPSMTAVVDGKTFNLPKGSIETFDDEIFMNAKVFEKLFPVNIDYDFLHQIITVDPREKLPFQARLEREQQRGRNNNRYSNQPIFPRATSGYSLLEIPSMDVGASAQYNNDTSSKGKLKSDYYFLSHGDLAKMTSEIFVEGDEKGLENTRFSLSRNDPDGKLLEPLKATNIALGDIRAPSFPIAGGGGNEKGIKLGNEELYKTSDFDTTYFEGTVPPGWDVEVYRNDILIDSQKIGANGRYDFNDVQLYYGKNDFRLIFYGPQGQKREETKRIDVGSEMLKKGQSEYQVSLTQKNSHLYDPDKIGNTADDDTLKMMARYQYGLNSNLSIEGGVLSEQIQDKRRNYIDLGVKANFTGVYVGADFVHDIGGGSAAEALVQTGIGPLDIRLKQQVYDNFKDYSDNSDSDLLKFRTNVSASGRIKGGDYIPDLPFSLSYTDTTRENSHDSSIGARIALNLKNLNVTNSLNWRNSNFIDPSPVIDGSIQASTQLGPMSIRGNVYYELDPETKIKSAQLTNQLNINENLSTELSLKQDFEDGNDLTGALSLNWNNGKYILSPQVSYDTNNNFEALLSFSTSIGYEPRSQKFHFSSTKNADKGSISARVYLDRNNNKIYDYGDKAIEGATVEAVQSYKKGVTDKNGIAFIPGISKNRPTDMRVDIGTLEDPFWEPSRNERSMLPRAGHVEFVDIPVITTGEIDGTVMMKRKDGTEKPIPNVPVQLVDNKGNVIKEVRSEYDGFYLFEGLSPNNYFVRIDPENAEKRNITTSKSDEISIKNDGTVINGIDMFFTKKPIKISNEKEKDVSTIVEKSLEPISNKKDIIEEPIVSENISVLSESSDSLGKNLKTESYKDILKKLASELGLLSIDEASFIKQNNSPVHKKNPVKIKTESTIEDSINETIQNQQSQSKITNKVTSVNQETDFGVHLASFKTGKKAIQGLENLQKQFGLLLGNDELTIKRVNLGVEKGVWYRIIAGKFKNQNAALSLKDSLQSTNQYASVIKYSL